MFVKETYNAKQFSKNVELAVSTFREAVETMGLKNFSVLRVGNGLDSIRWKVIEQILRTYFGKGRYTICICNSEVRTPPEADRQKIIQECHDSVVGGYKGETETFDRIRERFYWKGMREEIREYVRTCDSCQRKKLVRQKIKLLMQITHTPIRFFTKNSNRFSWSFTDY